MRHSFRRFVVAIVLFVGLAAVCYAQRARISELMREASVPELPAAVGYKEVRQEELPATSPETEVVLVEKEPKLVEPALIPEEVLVEEKPLPVVEDELPASFDLAVPFTSQAPFANWDATHEDTCEEASIYMVSAYYEGMSGTIAPQTAEDEIRRLVALENKIFGRFESTTAEETARLVTEVYGLRAEVEKDPTVATIKVHVAAGRPVIVPADGQMLGNPNFTGDGPPYHMFIIRGYVENRFVTNDPGTRRGEQYVYDQDVVMNAIHDWTGSDDTVDAGSKVILVIYPN